ncbi:MAG: UDP-3-O-(3-hydroxymyristoyl)glucosamine N-acyltransferase [Candidatus Marinimicrobia bacterium]|nr:UDP-3-O-(3-hydroxymyristoyl)glucosamine N-acyltransferase [Candidatus Neomarinimicrobiota bacterium]
MIKTLAEIGNYLGLEYVGDANIEINNVSEIQNAKNGEITFVGNNKYKKYLENTKASVVIVKESFVDNFPNIIISKDPQESMAKISHLFLSGRGLLEHKIHPKAVIDPTAKIGNNCNIGANSVIGRDVIIGNNVIIYSNIAIYDSVEIGDNCIIHSGAVIGSDGFGFTFDNEKFNKIPQLGKVIIGKNVEIGANSCIDRGSIGNTIIGEGTKIDNHVHFAHNVKVGKHCAFAGRIGVAGGTVIGNYCSFGGMVGINGHINIGNFVQVAAFSGISKDVKDGVILSGIPAIPIREFRRREGMLRKLPELYKTIKFFLKEGKK